MRWRRSSIKPHFFRRALLERPHANWIYRNLASALAGAGKIEEAKQAFADMMRHYPDLTVTKFKQAMVFSGHDGGDGAAPSDFGVVGVGVGTRAEWNLAARRVSARPIA